MENRPLRIETEDIQRYLGALYLDRELMRGELMRVMQELRETQEKLAALEPQEEEE